MSIDNRMLGENSAPRFIQMLQKQLIRENPSALPEYGVDGKYGSETTEWVRKFQERKGLTVDGIAGPSTLQRFRTDIVQRPNTNGRGVEILQEDLLYFYIQQSSVDGAYGPKTEQGVRDFQFLNGLTVDGYAGPNTLKRMDELITTILVQRGAENSLVRRLQHQLNEQEETPLSVIVDGVYGPSTENAIQQFQEATSLSVDGHAGPRTMNLLNLEATHPYSEEEIEDALAEAGIKAEEVSKELTEKYKQILENHEVFQRSFSVSNPQLGEDTSVIRTYVNAALTDKLITVAGQLKDNPNLTFYSSIDENTDELVVHNVFDVFGSNLTDEVNISSYNVVDEVVTRSTSTWVELDNALLELSIRSIEEAKPSLQQFSYQSTRASNVVAQDLRDQYEKFALCEGVGIGSCLILGIGVPAAGIPCSAAWAFTTVVVNPDSCDQIYEQAKYVRDDFWDDLKDSF